MRATLGELRDACVNGPDSPPEGLPLIIAGDLFDQPKPSPGLIRFAWEHLPDKVYCVAGQHDLPNHSREEIGESGLGVLQFGGRIRLLDPNTPEYLGPLAVYGFGWKQWPDKFNHEIKKTAVAVIHRYCWKEGHSFPGCPQEDHVDEQVADLTRVGYVSACWGDNHKGFYDRSETDGQGAIRWVNCGIAIPRNSDFKDYVPHYYYLLSDGSFEPVKFETEHRWQPWTDQEDMKESSEKLLAFTKEVAKLVGDQSKENFLDELEAAMKNLDDEAVRKKVWAVIQSATGALAK